MYCPRLESLYRDAAMLDEYVDSFSPVAQPLFGDGEDSDAELEDGFEEIFVQSEEEEEEDSDLYPELMEAEEEEEEEEEDAGSLQPEDVEDEFFSLKEMQDFLDEEEALEVVVSHFCDSFLLLVPVLTNVDTVFPSDGRRTVSGRPTGRYDRCCW